MSIISDLLTSLDAANPSDSILKVIELLTATKSAEILSDFVATGGVAFLTQSLLHCRDNRLYIAIAQGLTVVFDCSAAAESIALDDDFDKLIKAATQHVTPHDPLAAASLHLLSSIMSPCNFVVAPRATRLFDPLPNPRSDVIAERILSSHKGINVGVCRILLQDAEAAAAAVEFIASIIPPRGTIMELRKGSLLALVCSSSGAVAHLAAALAHWCSLSASGDGSAVPKDVPWSYSLSSRPPTADQVHTTTRPLFFVGLRAAGSVLQLAQQFWPRSSSERFMHHLAYTAAVMMESAGLRLLQTASAYQKQASGSDPAALGEFLDSCWLRNSLVNTVRTLSESMELFGVLVASRSPPSVVRILDLSSMAAHKPTAPNPGAVAAHLATNKAVLAILALVDEGEAAVHVCRMLQRVVVNGLDAALPTSGTNPPPHSRTVSQNSHILDVVPALPWISELISAVLALSGGRTAITNLARCLTAVALSFVAEEEVIFAKADPIHYLRFGVDVLQLSCHPQLTDFQVSEKLVHASCYLFTSAMKNVTSFCSDDDGRNHASRVLAAKCAPLLSRLLLRFPQRLEVYKMVIRSLHVMPLEWIFLNVHSEVLPLEETADLVPLFTHGLRFESEGDTLPHSVASAIARIFHNVSQRVGRVSSLSLPQRAILQLLWLSIDVTHAPTVRLLHSLGFSDWGLLAETPYQIAAANRLLHQEMGRIDAGVAVPQAETLVGNMPPPTSTAADPVFPVIKGEPDFDALADMASVSTHPQWSARSQSSAKRSFSPMDMTTSAWRDSSTIQDQSESRVYPVPRIITRVEVREVLREVPGPPPPPVVIEKIVNVPIPVPVPTIERIEVPVPVPGPERIVHVEKKVPVEVPVYVEKIVEKPVLVPFEVPALDNAHSPAISNNTVSSTDAVNKDLFNTSRDMSPEVSRLSGHETLAASYRNSTSRLTSQLDGFETLADIAVYVAEAITGAPLPARNETGSSSPESTVLGVAQATETTTRSQQAGLSKSYADDIMSEIPRSLRMTIGALEGRGEPAARAAVERMEHAEFDGIFSEFARKKSRIEASIRERLELSSTQAEHNTIVRRLEYTVEHQRYLIEQLQKRLALAEDTRDSIQSSGKATIQIAAQTQTHDIAAEDTPPFINTQCIDTGSDAIFDAECDRASFEQALLKVTARAEESEEYASKLEKEHDTAMGRAANAEARAAQLETDLFAERDALAAVRKALDDILATVGEKGSDHNVCEASIGRLQQELEQLKREYEDAMRAMHEQMNVKMATVEPLERAAQSWKERYLETFEELQQAYKRMSRALTAENSARMHGDAAMVISDSVRSENDQLCAQLEHRHTDLAAQLECAAAERDKALDIAADLRKALLKLQAEAADAFLAVRKPLNRSLLARARTKKAEDLRQELNLPSIQK